tara:strand:+ start:370 stop:546 length:177 start_codon:yes stop_codon:yes gene_type:complete
VNKILFLAEQNEENKNIVEDMKRLNRILIEELNKQNIKLPEGEHNDYIEFNTRDSAAF